MPSMVTEPVNALYRLLNTPKGTMPDPRDPQNQRDAINALMAVYGGNALGGVAKGALGKAASRVRNELDDATFQSKNASIYPVPNRPQPQRPFEADYKGQAPATQDGILTHDIEGRPLTAKYVVGRRLVGGEDEALSPAEYDAISEALFGNNIKRVAAREIGGDAGRFKISYDLDGTPIYQPLVADTIIPSQAPRVAAQPRTKASHE